MTREAEIYTNPPLTEPTFLVLLSLVVEPKHGYAIMKDTKALSEGRVVLSTGTLYGALKRLLKQGWIARLDDAEDLGESAGRQRKAYALTRLGRRILDAEIARLQSLVAAGRLRTSEDRA